MVDLDRTEREMILLLQEDGRMSFVDLARRIGVTEGTIRRKFQRLVQEGIIHIAAVSDPFRIGFNTPALIGINVETQRFESVVQALCALPRVRYVAAATGDFDILVEAYFASNEELSRFLIEDLAGIEGIVDTATSLELKIYKQSFAWGVAGHRPEPSLAGRG
ncbi:MAG: Lrp/AsnC family transcriptional regulator [Clostridia bacterium]|jgi:Lrp/AsnC family transcriptional regulator for asnA, asnC and gidA|nr:Lrp/AsnC family transcriptional regulator [Clostridia bacterium]MCL6522896.1 Lrp/AsnC family transcriptional regulator [Bacillota bacterium]